MICVYYIVGMFFVLPVLVFLCVKLGTYGYYSARAKAGRDGLLFPKEK